MAWNAEFADRIFETDVPPTVGKHAKKWSTRPNLWVHGLLEFSFTDSWQESTSSSVCWRPWPLPPVSSSLTRKQSRCAQVRFWNFNFSSSIFYFLDLKTYIMIRMFLKLGPTQAKWHAQMVKMESKSITKLFFEVEEKRGHTGSYGKQILYKTLAQVLHPLCNCYLKPPHCLVHRNQWLSLEG